MRFFGHTKPIRHEGEIIGSRGSPVRVKTREELGNGYGPDADKRLIMTAHRDDIIGLRPERTQRELLIKARDLYAHMVRLQANREHLERARQRKAAKAQQREARKERRLYR